MNDTSISRRPLVLSACLAVTLFASPGLASAADFPVGMNLAGVADWATEISFADAFKASRPWISQREGAAFGQGGPLDVDAQGWVKSLADKQWAEALMFVDIGNHYPGGKYLLQWDGVGEIEMANAANGTFRRPGLVDIDPAKGFVSLRLKKTDPRNYVRNIRLVPPEYQKKLGNNPFHPTFVKRYLGYNTIRFMDWQKTNNSKQQRWRDRPLPDDATMAGDKGVALETCIQLANILDVDPWFCIPHLADDDYVRNFAALVRKNLRPTRKVYVEYSNETWNSQFEQARYCKQRGLDLGLSTNEYEAQLRFSAQRSVEIFKIFEDVFGGKDRLVRVLAAQGANPWTGTTAMDWKDAFKNSDAIAIAPYFGNAYGDPAKAEAVSAMSVSDILDGCAEMVAENRKTNEKYAAEAKKRNLKLMAYESGQHLVGYGGAENNEKLTKLFHAANRHPRMKDLYLEDMKNWQEIGGGTFCVFSSMGMYSKWGSWGILEYGDQNPNEAPKFQAVQQVLRRKR